MSIIPLPFLFSCFFAFFLLIIFSFPPPFLFFFSFSFLPTLSIHNSSSTSSSQRQRWPPPALAPPDLQVSPTDGSTLHPPRADGASVDRTDGPSPHTRATILLLRRRPPSPPSLPPALPSCRLPPSRQEKKLCQTQKSTTDCVGKK